MIIPPGVDPETASREEIVAAYIEMGMDPDEAEAFADLILDPPHPDDPPIV